MTDKRISAALVELFTNKGDPAESSVTGTELNFLKEEKLIVDITEIGGPEKYAITPVGNMILNRITKAALNPEHNEAGGAHYGKGLQPWDLQRHMPSWDNVFIDARRTDVMEYLFRRKGGPEKWLDDAKKALHNCQVIIEELEKQYESPSTTQSS